VKAGNMANIELDVIVRGHVSGGGKSDVVNILKDSYRQFRSPLPYKVEVLITDSEAIMRDFLRQERFRSGVIEEDVGDGVCLYDALKGYPRISISLEHLQIYSKQARPGILRHQAAHSVLHGTMEYRIYRIPDDCLQIAAIKGIDVAVLEGVLKKLSVAVKDCEASKFLVNQNFINCQVAFVLEWIQTLQVIAPGKTPKFDRQSKFIYQISLLRPILLAHPLISVPKSKKIALEQQITLGSRLEELIGVGLLPQEQNRLIQISNMIAEGITEDTHRNVDFALHQALNLA
jgi:hypothetical protein